MNKFSNICCETPFLFVGVGHKIIQFDPGHDFLFLSTGDVSTRNSINLSEECLGATFSGKIISEYLQLLFLVNSQTLLDVLNNRVVFFQYRKFLSTSRVLRRAANMPYAFVCSISEAPSCFIDNSIVKSIGYRTLCTGPIITGFRSIADSYSRFHLVEDFTAFCASLSWVEGFSKLRISKFINGNLMIPSPSICIIETDRLLYIMSVLKNAWEVFYDNFYTARQGYQRRVGGFLLERLHSFLLLEMIQSGDFDRHHQLNLVVVNDGDVVLPTV